MALVKLDYPEPKVAVITLNDPDNLNAMSEAMAGEFRAVTEQLAKQKSSELPVAIVLTGAGRAFSAGGDLKMLEAKTQLTPEENRRRMLEFYGSFLGILKLNVPLIAAINGHAVGAGLCVASACDVRIASNAAKLGVTFTKLGLHPGMGATYFLPRLLGTSLARELMITGKMLTADEALKIGLVSEIVKPEDLMPKVFALCKEISTCGPQSVRQLLESLRLESTDLSSALQREANCQSINYASDEFKEGVRAIIEKRAPNF